MTEKNEKDKAVAEAMKQINKEYGSNTIMRMDGSEHLDIESISTGCFSLDYVFGCGGIPKSRIIEIYGQPSTGKSVLAMFIVAQAQKQGLKAVWIDAECAFSPRFASDIGVDVDKLIVCQPVTGESALSIVDKMASTHGIDIIVLDSVAALVPAKELEMDLIEQGMALQARMMSRALRVMTGNISRTNTAVIFLNQTREKLGIYWGPKETTPGGKALGFYASVRLEVKKGKNIIGANDEIIGNEIKIKSTKNKTGLPWRTAELKLIFRKGINLSAALLEAALARGVIKKVGNTHQLGEEKIAVGYDATAKAIEEQPELFKKINEALKSYDETNQSTVATTKNEEEPIEESKEEGD